MNSIKSESATESLTVRSKGFVPKLSVSKIQPSPIYASSPVLIDVVSTTSAWEVTEDDRSAVSVVSDVDDAEDQGDDDSTSELSRAVSLYLSDSFESALEALNGVENRVAKRLRGLITMKTTPLVRGCLRKEGRGHDVHVSISGEEPTFRDPSGGVRRDLAKETRSDNMARYEPKGVTAMIENRLKEMLDELEDLLPEPATHSPDAVIEVKFHFKDSFESFLLHQDSPMPSHATSADPTAKLLHKKGSDPAGLVALLEAASFLGLDMPVLTNKYGKGGSTPLVIAARSGREAVQALIKLGADPIKAVDGAIFMSERKNNLRWVLELLEALSLIPELVSPDTFRAAVRHKRQCGDTALLVAVNQSNLSAARALLSWGSQVDAEGQHRKNRSCYEIALERGSAPMIALLDQNRTDRG